MNQVGLGGRGSACCTSARPRVTIARSQGVLRARSSCSVGAWQTRRTRRSPVAVHAGRDPQGKLTRDAEPDQYWMDKNTKEGKSPFEDPMAIIGIFGLLSPFVILGIAIAVGYVEIGG